jgi:hypothetical protein
MAKVVGTRSTGNKFAFKYGWLYMCLKWLIHPRPLFERVD